MNQTKKYIAVLQTTAVVSAEERRLAETRYLELLERALGGSSKVRGAYCEYVAARAMQTENSWDTPTAAEVQATQLWEEASSQARQAVFDQLAIADADAIFELHIWRSRSY